jgi:hypothetical protein
MILIDTSVWIRAFIGREPFLSRLDSLMDREEVVGHELVYGELLIGDRGGRKKFLDDYALMHQARPAPHQEVVTFVRERKLHGRGVGWIDVHLLAAALAGGHQLWSADPRLASLAEELGAAYRI